ncbi:isopenicillin-N N-acyltransferase [Phlyctema vagabunda]|uniref:Isopenicillin-N N-acyltransferase n=1 Tax=Phlyctema vagabunda TaxID=108571 RepID=A0ABR4PCR1_9HELO
MTVNIMQEVHCSGTPREIGRQHGSSATDKIKGTLAFYTEYFQRKANMDWKSASVTAEKFLPLLERDWPELVEEMRGVAEGAGLPFSTILAMNVRTEISMGMMTDGCTALAWKTDDISLLAQNWDWEVPQQSNLIALHIQQDGKPSISQITEAGIIGKIGINSAGVGTCLNAIRAKGVDYNRLPAHLALRVALNSRSRAQAVARLEKAGLAAAAHILIGDATGATSLEFSALDLVRFEMKDGRIAHTNHFLVKHVDGVADATFMPDSKERMVRITQLLTKSAELGESPTVAKFDEMLQDEKGLPGAINRVASPASPSATLFSIVMDLGAKVASVKFGRPSLSQSVLLLEPSKM